MQKPTLTHHHTSQTHTTTPPHITNPHRDVFSSEDAVALTRRELLKGTTPQEMADKLTAFSLKRYTADNVAAVVVDLGICAKAKEGKKGGGGNGLFGGLFGR